MPPLTVALATYSLGILRTRGMSHGYSACAPQKDAAHTLLGLSRTERLEAVVGVLGIGKRHFHSNFKLCLRRCIPPFLSSTWISISNGAQLVASKTKASSPLPALQTSRSGSGKESSNTYFTH